MIDQVVAFLRDLLNAHLRAEAADLGESTEDEVVLIDGDKLDPISFSSGAVTALLVNLESDHSLPRPDPFRRRLPDGTQVSVAPEIRLNLYLLFVAKYKQYDVGLGRLSAIIEYFQHHRVLDRESVPTLPPGLDKLTVELVTMSFAEQNEIWGALRTTYHPSIVYRVRLVTVAEDPPPPGPEVLEVLTTVSGVQ